MCSNECSLIFSEGKYYSLTFNQELSKKIKELGFSRINIKQDDITGEIGIEINNEKGFHFQPQEIKELPLTLSWIAVLGSGVCMKFFL